MRFRHPKISKFSGGACPWTPLAMPGAALQAGLPLAAKLAPPNQKSRLWPCTGSMRHIQIQKTICHVTEKMQISKVSWPEQLHTCLFCASLSYPQLLDSMCSTIIVWPPVVQRLWTRMHLLALALALTVHVLLPACVCMVFSACSHGLQCWYGFQCMFAWFW